MSTPAPVTIGEVSLRDGRQIEPRLAPAEMRIALAGTLRGRD